MLYILCTAKLPDPVSLLYLYTMFNVFIINNIYTNNTLTSPLVVCFKCIILIGVDKNYN